MAAISAAFAEAHQIIEDLITEGDKVVYRRAARSVHKSEYMRIAATGKAVTRIGITFLRIEQGKIADHWAIRISWGCCANLRGK